jgi:glutaredoxin
MTVKDSLVLYSRAECHLCDLALAMLDATGLEWRAVDIDTDPVLTEKYGIHVPVVFRPADGRELFFPFDEQALLNFAAEA